jgi:nonsense-mediated mRNA decay protein 3
MTTDITQGIPREGVVHFCKGCEVLIPSVIALLMNKRYLQPPNAWVNAELESRELLALCLKKIKGLNKVYPPFS